MFHTSGDSGSSLLWKIPLRSGIPLAGVGPADRDHGHHPRARQRELPSLREVLLQPGLPGPHPQTAQAGEPKVRRGLEGAREQLRLSVLGHALLPYAAHAGAGHDDGDDDDDEDNHDEDNNDDENNNDDKDNDDDDNIVQLGGVFHYDNLGGDDDSDDDYVDADDDDDKDNDDDNENIVQLGGGKRGQPGQPHPEHRMRGW